GGGGLSAGRAMLRGRDRSPRPSSLRGSRTRASNGPLRAVGCVASHASPTLRVHRHPEVHLVVNLRLITRLDKSPEKTTAHPEAEPMIDLLGRCSAAHLRLEDFNAPSRRVASQVLDQAARDTATPVVTADD